MSDFTIDHGHADHDEGELLEQARGNAQALLLATIAFLETRGIPPRDWAAAIGETFGAAWGEPRPWDAGEFLDAMLTNLRALGAAVITVELGIARATAATTGFPDPELCALFGVSAEQVMVFHEAAAAIAAPRGLLWTARLDPDGMTRFTVIRAGDEG